MKYQNKLSRLRHAFLKLQGQDLVQVLLRAAAKEAEFVAENVHSTEEIFHAVKEKIYEATNELSWNEAFELVSDAESLAILKKELIEDVITPFRWDETLYVLLEDTEGTERSLLKAVLTNQYNYISMEEASNPNAAIGFLKLLVPITRRIFKNFEALKLVGVQPMTGPIGLAYLLRYRQQNEDGKCEDASEGSFEGKKITLDVISKPIEAGSRKLRAGWTIEAMQDLNSMHGLDIEAEMTQALAAEIQDEFTAEIIGDLHALAGEAAEIELDGFDLNAPVKLATYINRAANEIARNTRRGAGNWIVVPHTISVMLESLSESVYKKTSDKSFGLYGGLMEVGTLNGCIKVFSSLTIAQDEVLVGYKGGNGETDTGYVYAPYVPVMSSGIVVNSVTFQPMVTLMTRAGRTLNGDYQYDDEGNKLDVPPRAQNYYELIKIKGNLFTKKDKDD